MTVYRRALAVLLALAFPLAATAALKIAAKNRIRNRPPGRCGWCAVETLARHHHFASLYGLTKNHASRCSAEDLEEALEEGGIAYRIQYPGKRNRRNTEFLRTAIAQGEGAAIGFRERYKGSGKHIVTLVGWGTKTVRIIDSSDPRRHIKVMSKKRFLSYWDGFALVLEREIPKDQKADISAE
jgi:hypothetical protein